MKEELSLRYARVCAAVSGALFLAVLIAGGYRSARETEYAPPAAAETGISAFAADRNAVREEELSQLMSIAGDPATGDSIREAAQKRVMPLREWMEQEATIADVLVARGYEQPVVTVHSESVNVVVKAESLTGEEAGIILELVVRETGAAGGNVKIIPIN